MIPVRRELESKTGSADTRSSVKRPAASVRSAFSRMVKTGDTIHCETGLSNTLIMGDILG
jgi:hypothetical protein